MFRYPWVFLLFLPLVAWAWALIRNPERTVVPSMTVWRGMSHTWRTRLRRLPEVLWIFLMGTTLYLVAGPERFPFPDDLQTRGLNIALVLDRSGSMGVRLDPQKAQTRLDAVKSVLGEFLRRRENDGIALISFAGYAETHSPLTGNSRIIQDFLELIPLAADGPEAGTAIGDALMLAGIRLEEGRGQEKVPGVVLLLTDGRNNAGTVTPEEGAAYLAARGHRLFALGLGGTGYVMQEGIFGTAAAAQTVDLDVPGLQSIARLASGDYFQADTPGELDRLLKELEKGQLAQINLHREPEGILDLAPGLWLLVFLMAVAPAVRWFILRRSDS